MDLLSANIIIESFTASRDFDAHICCSYTNGKPHRWPDCDNLTIELSKFMMHMTSHGGENPYKCPHCMYTSLGTMKLNRHMITHIGSKPIAQKNTLTIHKKRGNVFNCEYCTVTYQRKADLRIHVKKHHTSDKPMHCTRCEKSFNDRYTLRVHQKSYEGTKVS